MNTSASAELDRSLDTVLRGLRDTAAPPGLEARVHKRLHNATAHRAQTARTAGNLPLRRYLPMPRAAALTLAGLAAAVIALVTPAMHRRQATTVTAQMMQRPSAASTHAAMQPEAAPQSKRELATDTPATPMKSNDPNDADVLALAETLAPSHAAPPLPLTAQERLLVRATRPGQPIEVAELDLAREPALRALADARERTALREYVHGLLGPIATAQALTPSSPPPDAASAPEPAPAPQP